MRILVFIKTVPDVKVPLGLDRFSGRMKADWHVKMLNPADRSAMSAALTLKKDTASTHITLVHLGPATAEQWIREGIADGCDQGVRVWDEGFDGIGPYGKALILARMAQILTFDLILTGNRSQDTEGEQVAKLMAYHLAVPCISPVTFLESKGLERGALVTRRLAAGFLEHVESPFPFVAAMEPIENPDGYASLPSLLKALEAEVECFDLAQIGISRHEIARLDGRLVFGSLQSPRPRTRYTPAPNSCLQAFDRIRRLVEGTVRRRQGKVVTGEEDQVVDELFLTLFSEGWLSHLQKHDG